MKMEWNDDWRTELESKNYSCFLRLSECRNTRNDIKIISKLMYKYNKNEVKAEDCLVRTLEWIGDWNNQFEVTDLTNEEYSNILKRIK